LEKAAKRENKTAWDVANEYTGKFMWGFDKLNLEKPKVFCKATEHINEQIELVKKIEEKGFVYRIEDGIYFDVKAYEEAGNSYGELSNLDKIMEGARVEPIEGKKDPRDFALWKFNNTGKKRDMEWESPWGIGFPGWHIECSAMSMKYLGERFDLHIGGEDLKSTHHPNEIAQAEAATNNKPFVKYWVHGAFLLVDGGRMGKSLGNAYTIKDLIDKGFSPMDLRYFYLTGHYRKQLNFTFEGLEAARSARERLVNILKDLDKDEGEIVSEYDERFKKAIEDDLNMPEALALLWEVVKSDLSDGEKYKLIINWDKVLGLRLEESRIMNNELRIPDEVSVLVSKREEARNNKNWVEADRLREEIKKMGFEVLDSASGVVVRENL
jgi:cysteinyl-tRNA synthetase